MAEENKVICSMYRVTKTVNGKQILKDINLSYFYGAKIGVLGLNGSGKSTLLRILAQTDTSFDGQMGYEAGISVGLLEQEPSLDPEKTVQETVAEAVAHLQKLLDDYDQTFVDLGEAATPADEEQILDRQGEIQFQIDALGAWDLEERIDMAMDALRCPPGETPVTILSGGERRRVALCRLLLREPDVLLLDEPTNHLDAETVGWLELHLRQYKGTVIAVTHDRYFLDNVAGWILELDRGHGIPWKGNYSSWLEQKQKRLEQEERGESARQRSLAREREWVSRSPKGRLAKSKARLKAYNELLNQDQREREQQAEIYIPPGPRLGNLVISAQHLTKGFGETLLMEDVAFELPPAGIVGVIGPNGAGKTTLFRMITGQEQPTSGSLRIGDSVKFAYVDQSRDVLDNSKNVWEVISDGEEFIDLGRVHTASRSYCARLGFTGADQQKPVGNLSGGERNRVHLARILKAGANVLLLDEPTNDLDVNTIRALETGLEFFAGCAVIISHDRWFLDRLATHILAFEGDSNVVWHEGNYSSYEADRKRRLGHEADQPHRIKYRRLTRA
ncbi:MAG: energy-dependent translational throttle protein EttA [Lentisphaerae bacterium]|jgi:energy-dependent translational throttle protein EttA|nr:energy-dependent translational throttle protein EttA [Lentisphaerota bacterium]MBT4814253.1 energy-dependent translational throttle protein EttA [Lentisphaerota bacterium]MBT5610971.1 energy-dependent translational throttle protein EttA [Lentisphaerota bacterium]MBT7058060.1 energy-dependent translational throttle protein EttA [Lentisphaerota bacterium]MBT7848067.1 energy-dependent translational throttle protein EttA [Lentisphaerota bacterium]